MAGRIRDEDVAYVREHAPIDEVVGDYVQLKNAGGGQKKGLCPFHDEKSPSFHVTPSRGFFHCFGCQTGGDVISFVMKIEHLAFSETVERLAQRIGFELRYEEGERPSGTSGGQRARLIEAHKVAAAFYQEALTGAGPAQVGRAFLLERGFDQQTCATFMVGYSPDEWDALTKHLKGKGFTNDELINGGLSKEGQRGLIDRFRNRLMWPIKDISGDIVGFGARKLTTDPSDTGPKYLNSPETPIYKKNQVLYGLDMAKKEIAKTRQAVVVEGYTDVMAAHVAGVGTAVATCGTAFGEEHIRIIRRLLMDDDAFRGEVIFTFDGDAAGQKAALRAFTEDQKFVTQTFVAIEKEGLDPCELRQKRGDAAVRELIANRIPLFEFAIRSTLASFNLNAAEGRVEALKVAAPLVAQIRDRSLRPEYTRLLAGWLGMEIESVRAAVATSVPKVGRRSASEAIVSESSPDESAPKRLERPDPRDPVATLEREVLKTILQTPENSPSWRDLEENDFIHEIYRALFIRLHRVEGAGDLTAIVEAIRAAGDDDAIDIASLAAELAVEPRRTSDTTGTRYGESLSYRLREVGVSRRIEDQKSELQRVNPLEEADRYQQLFADLVQMEAVRRQLRDIALGEVDRG
ncbi:MAG: DNA primase [Actinomycetes bacterium]